MRLHIEKQAVSGSVRLCHFATFEGLQQTLTLVSSPRSTKNPPRTKAELAICEQDVRFVSIKAKETHIRILRDRVGQILGEGERKVDSGEPYTMLPYSRT